MSTDHIAARARADTAVSAPPPKLRHSGSVSYDAASLQFTGKPPAGATINPDGTVTLALSKPVSVKCRRAGRDGGELIVYRELVFHRLSGAAVLHGLRAKAPRGRIVLARSLKISLADFALLYDALSECDRVVTCEVVVFLTQLEDGIPARVVRQADGGFLLPLLFPTSDGTAVHSSLQFQPLTKAQIAAIPKAADAFVPFALHHATGLPLRTARHLADTMDAADALAALEVLIALKERAQSDGRACVSTGDGRA